MSFYKDIIFPYSTHNELSLTITPRCLATRFLEITFSYKKVVRNVNIFDQAYSVSIIAVQQQKKLIVTNNNKLFQLICNKIIIIIAQSDLRSNRFPNDHFLPWEYQYFGKPILFFMFSLILTGILNTSFFTYHHRKKSNVSLS